MGWSRKERKILIDGEKVINFQFYDEENEEYSLKSMRIIDFLERYSEDTVPTIDIPTNVAIAVSEDGTVSRITGVKF